MENNSYVLKAGDSVTARGFGKFTYVKEVHLTKKDTLKKPKSGSLPKEKVR